MEAPRHPRDHPIVVPTFEAPSTAFPARRSGIPCTASTGAPALPTSSDVYCIPPSSAPSPPSHVPQPSLLLRPRPEPTARRSSSEAGGASSLDDDDSGGSPGRGIDSTAPPSTGSGDASADVSTDEPPSEDGADPAPITPFTASELDAQDPATAAVPPTALDEAVIAPTLPATPSRTIPPLPVEPLQLPGDLSCEFAPRAEAQQGLASHPISMSTEEESGHEEAPNEAPGRRRHNLFSAIGRAARFLRRPSS